MVGRLKEEVQSCLRVKDKIHETVHADIFSVPHNSRTQFRNKSTVGIMLHDCTVDGLVIGGPAFLSKAIEKGDVIVKIDNKETSAETILSDLVGSDLPGSTVLLHLNKVRTGKTTEIELKKMSTETIAAKLNLFDLFTKTKELAHDNPAVSTMIDDCIEAWTEMTEKEGEKDLVRSCQQLIDELHERLKSLMEIGSEIEGHQKDFESKNIKLEQDIKSLTLDNQHLTTEAEDLKSKILMLQGNISQFEEKLAKETNDSKQPIITQLTKEVEKAKGLNGLLSHQSSTIREQMLQCSAEVAHLVEELSSQKSMSEMRDEQFRQAATEQDKLKAQLLDLRGKTKGVEADKEALKDELERLKEKQESQIESLQGSIGSLKGELEGLRAVKHQQSLDFKSLQAQMNSVKSKCDQVSADYDAARRELEALRAALEQKEYLNCNLSVECENQSQKIHQNEQLIRENTRRVKDCEEQSLEIDALRKGKTQLQGLLESLRTENSRLIGENVNLMERYHTEKALRADATDRLASFSSSFSDIPQAINEDVFISNNLALANQDASLQEFKSRRRTEIERNSNLRFAMNCLTTQLSACFTHIQFRELHENLEATRKKLSATENEIYVLKENESRLSNAVEDRKRAESSLTLQLADKEAEILKLEANSVSLEAKVNELRTKLHEQEQELEQRSSTLKSLEMDMQDTTKKLAIEVSEKERLSHALAAEKEAKEKQLDELYASLYQTKSDSPASFDLVSKGIDSLLFKLLKAGEENNKLKASLQELQDVKAVNLDVNRDLKMSKEDLNKMTKMKEALTCQVEYQKRKMAELEQEISRMKEQESLKDARIDELSASISKAAKDQETSRADADGLNETLQWMARENSQLKAAVEKQAEERTVLAATYRTLDELSLLILGAPFMAFQPDLTVGSAEKLLVVDEWRVAGSMAAVGDRILRIDETGDVKEAKAARELLRGPRASSIQLKMLRAVDKKEVDVQVTRSAPVLDKDLIERLEREIRERVAEMQQKTLQNESLRKALDDQSKTLKSEKEQQQGFLGSSQALYIAMQKTIQHLESNISKLVPEVEEIKLKVRDEERKVERLQQTCDDLQGRNQSMQKKCRDLKSKFNAYDEWVQHTREEVEMMKESQRVATEEWLQKIENCEGEIRFLHEDIFKLYSSCLLREPAERKRDYDELLRGFKAACGSDLGSGTLRRMHAELAEIRRVCRSLVGSLTSSQRFKGVGMIVRTSKQTVIKELLPGGPADESGELREGDVVLSVNGRDLAGLSALDVQRLIVGPEGTSVCLRVRREEGTVNVVLTRSDLHQTSMVDEMQEATLVAESLRQENEELSAVLHAIHDKTKVVAEEAGHVGENLEKALEASRESWKDVSIPPRYCWPTAAEPEEGEGKGEEAEEWRRSRLPVRETLQNTDNVITHLGKINEVALELIHHAAEEAKKRSEVESRSSDLKLANEELQQVIAGKSNKIAEMEAKLVEQEREYQRLDKHFTTLLENFTKFHSVVLTCSHPGADVASSNEVGREDGEVEEGGGKREFFSMDDLQSSFQLLENAAEHNPLLSNLKSWMSGAKTEARSTSQVESEGRKSQMSGGRLDMEKVVLQLKQDVLVVQSLIACRRQVESLAGVLTSELKALGVATPQLQVKAGSLDEVSELCSLLTHQTRSHLRQVEELRREREEMHKAAEIRNSQVLTLTYELEACQKTMEVEGRKSEAAGSENEALRAQLQELAAQLELKQQEKVKERRELEEEAARRWQLYEDLKRDQEYQQERTRQCEQEARSLQSKLNAAHQELMSSQSSIKSLYEEQERYREEMERAVTAEKIAKNHLFFVKKELGASKNKMESNHRKVLALEAEVVKLRQLSKRCAKCDSRRANSAGKVGIGMSITDKAPHRITSILPGSAASACPQVCVGDVLVAVDGVNVEKLPLEIVRRKLLGEEGRKLLCS
ncbi:hypothetical protein GUITHDRAFT_149349 [Guillardia theta CCMP2712]|uniref:PDZ domain-containing protein n=3 Tax=Guillardia theta TaxID=55529 RepID=L1I682_GUITC|nr:hypothetical protein GUITHDRAFT_149349 [Guillardia theta CCMP2712]EKX31360.1 hypothetical protein GUITHDRAFT_149349 [Guillardia theta CCMP2712]|eukprot:XP_005818340.1 hypothetical protein GUITHDRAFT_149349 [Guillardia theta CCMP2712]